jgi:hypothetical protein
MVNMLRLQFSQDALQVLSGPVQALRPSACSPFTAKSVKSSKYFFCAWCLCSPPAGEAFMDKSILEHSKLQKQCVPPVGHERPHLPSQPCASARHRDQHQQQGHGGLWAVCLLVAFVAADAAMRSTAARTVTDQSEKVHLARFAGCGASRRLNCCSS